MSNARESFSLPALRRITAVAVFTVLSAVLCFSQSSRTCTTDRGGPAGCDGRLGDTR